MDRSFRAYTRDKGVRLLRRFGSSFSPVRYKEGEGTMKIEVDPGTGLEGLTASHPPTHRGPLYFWGSAEGEIYPYVIEVPEDEGRRILQVLEEFRSVQARLRQLISGLPPPKRCACGSCPVEKLNSNR